ncbi:MAG TPA: alpha/beta hydrolase [Nocardioides sp.]|uniref:alpha/beta fold hydrolase n=1 Tax=Nocardioides sp. TaxID=35761 RepID=UPI002E35258C|nr:alpha/beta hydrolase [Nocardioides sp.]HEX5087194.1 alpha/beta hydrolase [Nocardioides sp.]
MKSRVVAAADGVPLHVGTCGTGPDVVVLSGGPGLVNYLADERLAPDAMRAWFPEPRGVGRSGGGPHSMAQAVADLETIRESLGITAWSALGHSWGSDLAVRYALDHPASVTRGVGVAGHGLHKDRTWSAAYERGRASEPDLDLEWAEDVWRALSDSFVDWIHEPELFRRLADSPVPMHFVAAGDDIRPSWPLQQLAALVPAGRFETLPGVPHDFWATHPASWRQLVNASLSERT